MAATPSISVIVATTSKGGIGKDGALPWKLPEDMAHFKKITTAAPSGKMNAVVMGRKTWESIPEKFKPLAGRVNVVLSRKVAEPSFASPYPADVLTASSVADALKQLALRDQVSEIFAIGGESVYKEALDSPSCDRLFITRIAKDIECDAFFPAFDATLFKTSYVSKTKVRDGLPYDFIVYERIQESDAEKEFVAPVVSPAMTAIGGTGQFLHEEYQYLNLIREICEKGFR
jgi:dihydrofolate reductase/thymidylate synthase